MEISEIKKIIHEINPGNIVFTKHFKEREIIRKLPERLIFGKVIEIDSMIGVEDQGTEAGGHKYAVLYKYLGGYDLKIVFSIKGNVLSIITSHVVSKKRKGAYKKWLDLQK